MNQCCHCAVPDWMARLSGIYLPWSSAERSSVSVRTSEVTYDNIYETGWGNVSTSKTRFYDHLHPTLRLPYPSKSFNLRYCPLIECSLFPAPRVNSRPPRSTPGHPRDPLIIPRIEANRHLHQHMVSALLFTRRPQQSSRSSSSSFPGSSLLPPVCSPFGLSPDPILIWKLR